MNQKEKYPIPSVCTIVVEPGGQILLAKRLNTDHEPNTFCCPGGKIDAGEFIDEAAFREFQEETGLSEEVNDVALYRMLGFVTSIIYPNEGNHFICFWYVFELTKKFDVTHIEKRADGLPKFEKWEWYDIETAFKLPLFKATVEGLKYYSEDTKRKCDYFQFLEKSVV